MNIELFYETVILCLMAAMSPGPNFLMTVANTNENGRIAGLMTAFGVAIGVTFWLFLCGFGLAFIIVDSPFIQKILNYTVAIFLVYIGARTIKNRHIAPQGEASPLKDSKNKLEFFAIGLTGTIFNGGVGIFYGAIFTKIITEYGKNYPMILFHITIFNIIELLWFVFVAVLVSFASKFIRQNYAKINLFLGILILYYAVQYPWQMISNLIFKQ